jgi:uncharacterized membrane protein YfcA
MVKGLFSRVPGWLKPILLVLSLPVVVIGGMLISQLLALLLGLIIPVVLVGTVIWMFFNSIHRFKHPELYRDPSSRARVYQHLADQRYKAFTLPMLDAYLKDNGHLH